MTNTEQNIQENTNQYLALTQEWTLLQNQFDSYEKHALFIKLISIVLVFGTLFMQPSHPLIVLVFMTLWLQDAIWKTFQSRIEPRLHKVERAIKNANNQAACQFNSDYLTTQKGGAALIVEYLSHAIRPTIAFPHVINVALVAYLLIG